MSHVNNRLKMLTQEERLFNNRLARQVRMAHFLGHTSDTKGIKKIAIQASLLNNTIFSPARHPWKIPVSNPI
jgi:hypothetical protein